MSALSPDTIQDRARLARTTGFPHCEARSWEGWHRYTAWSRPPEETLAARTA